MDGLLCPTSLTFDVPAIPKAMLEKALWYVEHQDTHMVTFDFTETPGEPAFYVLSQTGGGDAKTITKRHREMFAAAMAGERDSRIKDLNSLMQVCQSLHLVCQPVEGMTVPECEGNKEKYDCVGCKSFKAVGICSHVLAVNHVSKKYNVRYVLGRLQTGASKTAAVKAGKVTAPPPALQRAPVADPDSSDEEEARLLQLGEQGR